jgi:hypothetical protein
MFTGGIVMPSLKKSPSKPNKRGVKNLSVKKSFVKDGNSPPFPFLLLVSCVIIEILID